MIPKKLIPAIAMLMLCGAGCFSKGADNAVNPSVTGTEAGKTTSTANVGVEDKASGEASSTLVAIDDTWKTYQSAASGFSFRYPTKGSLAPQWEVKYSGGDEIAPGTSHKLVQEGCMIDGSYVSKSTYEGFCHSRSEIELGDMKKIDYYTMKKGERYLTIVFTKQIYWYGDCLSVNKNSCVKFSDDDYLAVLNTSMSTFKFDK